MHFLFYFAVSSLYLADFLRSPDNMRLMATFDGLFTQGRTAVVEILPTRILQDLVRDREYQSSFTRCLIRPKPLIL